MASSRVENLLESAGVSGVPSSDGRWEQLNEATFQDQRWENALRHLRGDQVPEDDQWAHDLLRSGAQAFGLWHVSDTALAALAQHLLGREPAVSPALHAWLSERSERASGDAGSVAAAAATSLAELGGPWRPSTLSPRLRAAATITTDEVRAVAEASRSWGPPVPARRAKLALLVAIAALSCAFAAPLRPSRALETFGWPLVVARACGMGTLLCTSVLFLSMSRTLLTGLYRWLPAGRWAYRLLAEHTSIHAFCGELTLLLGALHAAAHYLSTYWALAAAPPEELNGALRCAGAEAPGPLAALRWPPCPLERNYSLAESVVSVPGLTGFSLLALLLLMGWSARAAARGAYDRFWHAHNAGILLWLPLLLLHGAQDWFGAGVPLVLLVCAAPCAPYLLDRALRLLRYGLFGGRAVRIVSAVIRPGKDGGADGAITALEVTKPPCLWNFREGMYAFICAPEVSRWQWHPFTICSGKEDESVDFLVLGVGDWTRALAQRCLDFQSGERPYLPTVALDGPYAAPATTALACEVLIAAGAGIGITPFLSLMARIVALLGEGQASAEASPREAHFFWMTRSADEFLFGRRHFTRIASRPQLRGRVFLHLHLTQQEPGGHAPAFLFREAVRRQSALDRAAFSARAEGLSADELAEGPQLPFCWVNGSSSDVLWVSSLVEARDEEERGWLGSADSRHWAEGSVRLHVGDPAPGDLAPGAAPWPAGPRRSGSGGPQRCGSGLFRSRTALGSEGGAACGRSALDAMLPVVFGRPDFATEVQAIGKARPEHDVGVYACGSPALVECLREVCKVCASHARAKRPERPQRYVLHHERFGGR